MKGRTAHTNTILFEKRSLGKIATRCHFSSFDATGFHSLSLVVPLVVTRCHLLYHSLSLVVIRCHSLYHSLSLVVPLVVIRCHSLSLVVSIIVIRCHSLSLDVPLVCLINDHIKLNLCVKLYRKNYNKLFN